MTSHDTYIVDWLLPYVYVTITPKIVYFWDPKLKKKIKPADATSP